MRTHKSVLLATLLFLPSCGTSPGPRDLPASDLAVVKLAVQQMTQPRPVQGKVTRLEDAQTGDDLFRYGLAVEQAKWLDEQDKLRLRFFINDALDVVEESRKPPCPWWNYACIRNRRALLGTNQEK